MTRLFICHASEDKEDIVRPLAERLLQAGNQVWYDEYALKLGDSLRRSIDQGLAEADYGIVILSPAFFAKSWTQRELGGLMALEAGASKPILPVWHKVGRAEVERFSPMLADKLSVSTDGGIVAVVEGVQYAIQGKPLPKRRKRFPAVSWRLILLLGVLAVFGLAGVQLYSRTLAPRFARAKLDALPLSYTPETFVEKAAQGELEAVNLFLKAGMNPDIHEPLRIDRPSGRTALALAAAGGHIDIVEALLDGNANVNERDEYYGTTALSWAASEGHLDIVRLLLKAGADQNAKNEAVERAVRGGHIETLHLLLENGANLDRAMAQEVFSGAVSYSNNLDMVKYLLSFGIDINAKDKDGYSALLDAAMNEKALPAIQLLLERGADVNIRNNDGETPIMRTYSIAILRALISGGADVNAKDNNGNSVLRWFLHSSVLSRNESEQFIKILIAHGADVNATIKDPPVSLLLDLLQQQSYDDLSQFNLLIDSGADVNFKDDQGYTPLMYALQYFSDRYGEEDDDWLISKVSKLLEKGAKVQDRAADATTALKLAEKLPKGTKTRVLKLLQNRI